MPYTPKGPFVIPKSLQPYGDTPEEIGRHFSRVIEQFGDFLMQISEDDPVKAEKIRQRMAVRAAFLNQPPRKVK